MTFELRILALILGLFFVSGLKAQTSADQRMLARATPYFVELNQALDTTWPEVPQRSVIAAQVERESLWNPRAELCVPRPTCARERGVGFGQFTITPRMNVFEEVKRMDYRLREWQWKDRFDPRLQLIAVAVKDKAHYQQCSPLMKNSVGAMACVMSSYNGGFGGFTADRRLCGNTKGCDPTVWFSNVEGTSLKMKTALAGYGKSFFEINRGYVCDVLRVRSVKYRTDLQDREPPLASVACVYR